MTRMGNNPWPEESDYGKFWRRGYQDGRSDALKQLQPAIVAALKARHTQAGDADNG